MTREDIICMVQETIFAHPNDNPFDFQIRTIKQLQHFASLVAAAEREAIAQSLDKQADLACDEIDRQWAQEMAAAVRARSRT